MTATTLEEANLSAGRAALLLAVADGVRRIGAARTGVESGQFSIFNFLLRCAEEEERRDDAGRSAFALMMQAGIARRRAWYCRFWLPEGEEGLRLEVPAPLPRGWEWWADVEEIARRLGPSAAWAEVVGEPLEARAAYFREALGNAVVERERE